MTSERYYKPELDVLRLCAFLFVFFVHRLDLAPIDPAKFYCRRNDRNADACCRSHPDCALAAHA